MRICKASLVLAPFYWRKWVWNSFKTKDIGKRVRGVYGKTSADIFPLSGKRNIPPVIASVPRRDVLIDPCVLRIVYLEISRQRNTLGHHLPKMFCLSKCPLPMHVGSCAATLERKKLKLWLCYGSISFWTFRSGSARLGFLFTWLRDSKDRVDILIEWTRIMWNALERVLSINRFRLL